MSLGQPKPGILRLANRAVVLLVFFLPGLSSAESREPTVELVPESLSDWQIDYHERVAKTGTCYINIQHDGTIRVVDGLKTITVSKLLSREELATLYSSIRTILNRFFLRDNKGFNEVSDGYSYELRLSVPDGRFVFVTCDQTVPYRIGVERAIERIRAIMDKCLRLAMQNEKTQDHTRHLPDKREVLPDQRVPASLREWGIGLDDRKDIKWNLRWPKVTVWKSREVISVRGEVRSGFEDRYVLDEADGKKFYESAAHLLNRYTLSGIPTDKQLNEPVIAVKVRGYQGWGEIAVGYNRFAIENCGVTDEFEGLINELNRQLMKAGMAERLSLIPLASSRAKAPIP